MFANGELAITWPALVVATLNVILIVNNRERYKTLFAQEG
jgi:hypothetical protein